MAQLLKLEQEHKLLQVALEERFAALEAQVASRGAITALSSDESQKDSFSKQLLDLKTFTQKMCDSFTRQLNDLHIVVDDLQTRQRADTILVRGIPEESGEKVSNCVLTLLQDKMGLSVISDADIFSCHRLGPRAEGVTRSIVVTFYSRRVRQLVWSNKAKLKGSSVSLSEFLTRRRQAIFTAARTHFGVRSSWTNDGVISVRLPDKSVKRLTGAAELDELIRLHPKTKTDAVITPVSTPSVEKASTTSRPKRQKANNK